MKTVSKCLVVALLFSTAALYAGVQAGAPSQAQQDKAFEGTLVKIDADSHMLMAKGSDNKEWQFTYTDATQVISPDKSIQGLAGKTGANLKITYRVEQNKNRATRIEVLPEK